jgi:hypothetical protein
MIKELNPHWRRVRGSNAHTYNYHLSYGQQWQSFHKFGILTVLVYFLHIFGLALADKDIVIRFIIEYGSLRDFGP